mmetsp:Transcript_191/g.452  ORF Transcript_191/g.452 Transcript_191/m.452 type:complete len:205 (-) Transcript_191:129-743(-)
MQCDEDGDVRVVVRKFVDHAEKLVVVPVEPMLVLNVKSFELEELGEDKHLRPAASKRRSRQVLKEIIGVGGDAAGDSKRFCVNEHVLVNLMQKVLACSLPGDRKLAISKLWPCRSRRHLGVVVVDMQHGLLGMDLVNDQERPCVLCCEGVEGGLGPGSPNKVYMLVSLLLRQFLDVLPARDVAHDHRDAMAKGLSRYLTPPLTL